MFVLVTLCLLLSAVSAQDGASTSGLSSGALGGVVAGVFIGVTICICIALFGFCCWNNYQDSHMMSYNYNAQSGENGQTTPNETGSDNASHFCGCTRLNGASSVVHYLQCGCYRDEDSQCQSNDTMIDVLNVTDSDVNVVAPSVNAVSEDNDATDCGINISPSSMDNITTSAEINVTNNEMSGQTTPRSPSSVTLVVNVDVTNDDTNVTPSLDINIPPTNDEVIVALGSQDVTAS